MMRRRLKAGLRWFFSYLPFVNRFKLRGAKLFRGRKMVKGSVFDCMGSGNVIRFLGQGTLKDCHFFVRGNGNVIEIGENTSAYGAQFWIEDDNGSIVIGRDSNLTGKCQLASIEGCGITIGDNCLFSSEIVIRTGDSHTIANMDGERINESKGVMIDDHVWVGHRVSVNKGVHIAPNCVIGTNAVVTKSIDSSNVIAAGNPARIIKENISWDINRI